MEHVFKSPPTPTWVFEPRKVIQDYRWVKFAPSGQKDYKIKLTIMFINNQVSKPFAYDFDIPARTEEEAIKRAKAIVFSDPVNAKEILEMEVDGKKVKTYSKEGRMVA